MHRKVIMYGVHSSSLKSLPDYDSSVSKAFQMKSGGFAAQTKHSHWKARSKAMKLKQVCRDWRNAWCSWGDQCKFGSETQQGIKISGKQILLMKLIYNNSVRKI